MTTACIIGYDPGGNDAHGVAVLDVKLVGVNWIPISLQVSGKHSLHEAIAWLKTACLNKRIVAVGVDTLTEWNSGCAGWRPADSWLKNTYKQIERSVVSSNSIMGSMAVNGAAFLTILAPRFRADGTMITEAHPKVCYFALTGKKHAWDENRSDMTAWLLNELGLNSPASIFGKKDDSFDAGISLLAALCGLNGVWNVDLHALPENQENCRVQFAGPTHFWWPQTAQATHEH